MENLYETLNSKVKENIKKEKRFKQSKNNGKDYKYTKERNILVTNEMKAYFYYKYFIENILSFYLKEQIESSEELSLRKAKSQKFKFELNINYKIR